MITVWGEGRGFRVVWMLEEMGLPYRLRPVDLLKDLDKDTEFLAINPAAFIPALQDGDAVIVESIAIIEYLAARYGPTPIVPAPGDPAFATYLQFLHLGEAGLAGPIMVPLVSNFVAPEAERDNWGARWGQAIFDSRMKLVARQLAQATYMAGDAFTAADISVTYALELAQRNNLYAPDEAASAYLARTTAREGYQRAMDACAATKAWVESLTAK